MAVGCGFEILRRDMLYFCYQIGEGVLVFHLLLGIGFSLGVSQYHNANAEELIVYLINAFLNPYNLAFLPLLIVIVLGRPFLGFGC